MTELEEMLFTNDEPIHIEVASFGFDGLKWKKSQLLYSFDPAKPENERFHLFAANDFGKLTELKQEDLGKSWKLL